MEKVGGSVAVTGMAWSTALGDDLEQVWQALLQGKSGLRAVPFVGRLRNSLAAPATDVNRVPRERLAELGCASIKSAWLPPAAIRRDPEVQLVLATSLGAYLDDASSRVSLSRWARDLAEELGAVAPPIVVSTACSSGSDAIMVGAELVRSGAKRCCVSGGVDVLTSGSGLRIRRWVRCRPHDYVRSMSGTMARSWAKAPGFSC